MMAINILGEEKGKKVEIYHAKTPPTSTTNG